VTSFTIAANNSNETRSGTLTIAGQTFVITQERVSQRPGCEATGFLADPNPILTRSNFGGTTLKGAIDCNYEIRIGSSFGVLLAGGNAGRFTIPTGNWVGNGTKFYLQAQGDLTALGTRGVVTATVQNTTPPSCQVTNFSVSPSPIFSDSGYGVATLVGNVSCAYDIRVGRPDGALFESGTKGAFSAKTGKWVSDGLVFYLQVHGNRTSSGTLAVGAAKVSNQASSNCTAENFAANPNPIRTNSAYGETTLTGSAGCAFDIRVSAPDGTLLTSGSKGDFTVKTGKWITSGMMFYLQSRGNRTLQGTLAIAKAER